MAGLKSPNTTKVEDIRPGSENLNLNVKVVDTKVVLTKPRTDSSSKQIRIAESIVGDETGVIVLTLRNEQVDLGKKGAVLSLKNAKVDLFRGSMRLLVDKSGKIELNEDSLSIKVDDSNNMSLIEYETIIVVEE